MIVTVDKYKCPQKFLCRSKPSLFVALYRHHSLNLGLVKCPTEKQTSSHWPVKMLCMDSS